MKLRFPVIGVAVLGIVAFFVSGLEYEIAGFPAAISDAAWPIFMLAALIEIGLGITALVRRIRRASISTR